LVFKVWRLEGFRALRVLRFSGLGVLGLYGFKALRL
jgi:hypothetical protein